MVFVDQAPLQNYTSDWGPEYGNRGCNNPQALDDMQRTLESDPKIAHLGTIGACLGYRSHPQPGDPEPGSSSGAPPVYANEPPAYVPSQTLPTLPDSVPAATTTTSAEPDTEEVAQPIMLVLAGESIHPRTASWP